MTAFSEPTDVSSKLEDHLYAKVAWRLIPSLFLFFVFGYLDRVNIGFAKLDMEADLKWTESIYGFGAGMFFIGYFVFEVPSNVILYRMGARRWLACMMVAWGILSGCMMFVHTKEFFYVLRFAIGVAEAGFFPGIIYYLMIWFPKARRARVTALFMSAIGISGAVGGPLSGWIMASMKGVQGLTGWEWLFLLEGIPSVLMGILALIVLDNSIQEARWLNADEKALLERNIVNDSAAQESVSILESLKMGRVWFLSLVYFLILMGLYGYLFWTPQMIKSSGVTDNFHVGLLSAIPPVLGVLFMVVMGRHSDRTAERRWHFAWSGFLAMIGFVLCAMLEGNTTAVMMGLILATSGVLAALPLFWSFPTEILKGIGAAAGIGLINSIGNLAGFVSNNVMGMIRDKMHSSALGLYLIAACVCLSGVLILLVGRSTSISPKTR
jgi:MFS family permease